MTDYRAITNDVVEAFSSRLCQPTSEMPYEERVHDGFVEGAGFVCILARKYPLGVNYD